MNLSQLVHQIEQLSPENQAKLSQYVAFLQWQENQPPETEAVSWSFSFIEAFQEATIYSSQEAAGLHVQLESATVDEVEKPALWAHPPVVGQTVIEYHVPIPQQVRQITLRLAIGIRDGSKIAANNLIAFSVRVNGLRVWGQQTNQLRWQAVDIPLDLPPGDISRIAFATEALNDHQWTWAVWGTPELVGQVVAS